ncbi:alpha/beta hydrolase [Euzebya sp.]|uniref:alpha/beta hydrolase n=1 Tax=Euzebya sp. TaxID=1971409 RepID=UPI003514F143
MPRALTRFAATATTTALGVAAWRGLADRRRRIADVVPELRAWFLHLPLHLTSRTVLRAVRALPETPAPVLDGVAVTTRTVVRDGEPPVEVVCYEPPTRPSPSGALLWIHGGGFVMGTVGQGHATCSRVAAELGVLVVSVDYRLAPEHPFPAGLGDCHDALRWLHDHADELDVDPARIAVGGDSAGGGMAATLCQRARDLGGPPIAFQALVYPMLDDRTALRDDVDGVGDFVWTPASNAFAWEAYLGHPAGAPEDRPHAVAARADDLAGLPPAWIGVGTLDLFLDEDVAYARRLEEAGVAVDLDVVEGLYHGGDGLRPDAPISTAFSQRMRDALRGAIT